MFGFVFPCHGFGVWKDDIQHAASGQGIVVMDKKLVPKTGRAPSSWGGPTMIDRCPIYSWLAAFYKR